MRNIRAVPQFTRKIGIYVVICMVLIPLISAELAQAVIFSNRCSATGVEICFNFDDAQEIRSFLYYSDSSVLYGSLDSTIKSSGAGSLKFIIPTNSNANSSGGLQRIIDEFGAGYNTGDTFYVQFRQRFSPEMLGPNASNMGGNGWKQMTLSSRLAWYGDGNPMSIGLFNKDMAGYPVLYFGDETRYLEQNPTDNIKIPYTSDQWMTFYLKVTIGTWGQPNSSIEGWIGTETTQLKKVFNYTAVTLYNNPADTGAGFNKIELTTNNTNKLSVVSHTQATTWFDELIVSVLPIGDPVDPTPTPTPIPTPIPSPAPKLDTTAPYVSGISITNIATAAATVNWTTNEPANGQVEFCTTYSLCGIKTPLVSDFTLQHSINLIGLTSFTKYYIWISSKDVSGNSRLYYRTFTTADIPDIIPPVISISSPLNGADISGRVLIQVNASDNRKIAGVKFMYDNNIPFGYEDFYAPYSAYLSTSGLSVGPHTIHVLARDSSGNVSRSFIVVNVVLPPDTIAPYISGVWIKDVTSSTANVTWNTSELADGQIEYCIFYGRCGTISPLFSGLTTQHSIMIEGLSPYTTYYVWITSRDLSGNARTYLKSFRTLRLN